MSAICQTRAGNVRKDHPARKGERKTHAPTCTLVSSNHIYVIGVGAGAAAARILPPPQITRAKSSREDARLSHFSPLSGKWPRTASCKSRPTHRCKLFTPTNFGRLAVWIIASRANDTLISHPARVTRQICCYATRNSEPPTLKWHVCSAETCPTIFLLSTGISNLLKLCPIWF